MNQSKVFGCSAFGLKDCVASPDQGCTKPDLYLADAVLPRNPFGAIRTGQEAEQERTHAGLSWPPEARVKRGRYLRRVPIPYAWQALVEAGDRTVRWNVGDGVSFSLPKILACHIEGLLNDDKTRVETNQDDLVVVAIPDHLDEFGQDGLLKELATCKLRNVRLVWRPVAAALSWLDKVGKDFLGHIEKEDHIHVVYIGPDAVEFTTFRLKVWQHYVLPLRDRPQQLLQLTGMDWAGRVIEECFDNPDDGAFWQAFTNFPEVWAAIAGMPWNLGEIPRPWSVRESWSLWDPPEGLFDTVFKVHAGHCGTLREIHRTSCPLRDWDKNISSISWSELLRSEVKRRARLYPQGRLRGMILCGPLMSITMPSWLESELGVLADRGLDVEGPVNEPKAGRLWNCSDCDDAIADGAAIYGRRILNGIPTYLDTLPQLSILAYRQEEYEYDWIELVDSKELEGGGTYRKSIEGRFLLPEKTDRLEVYLKKGERERFRQEDSQSNSGIPAELTTLFRKISEKRAPFRKAQIRFPAIPDNDTVLDLEVWMRAASGMAKVEILPRESDFLKGRRVFLDYSLMRYTDTLPEVKRGWPETVKMEITNDPSVFTDDTRFNAFLAIPLRSNRYIQVLTSAKEALTSGVQVYRDNRYEYVKKMDQDGQTGSEKGQEVIQAIASKLEEDFQSIYQGRELSPQAEKMIIRGTWLWAGAPPSIVQFLEKYLKGEFRTGYRREWLYFTEAASRCFLDERRYRILFTAIYKRLIRQPEGQVAFPIQSARSIYRLLLHRPDGQDGLDKDMATTFLKEAVKLVQEQVREENLQQTFFQSLLLFFVLLRYRKRNRGFVDPDNPSDRDLLDSLFWYLDKAERWFVRYQPLRAERVRQILEGIKNYMKYEGSPGIVYLLAEMAEEG